MDICAEIVEIAKQRHPAFEFVVAFPDKEEFTGLSAQGKNSITSSSTNRRYRGCASSAAQSKAAVPAAQRLLVATYNHLWEPLVAFRMDGDESAAHGRKLAVHRRYSKPDEARRVRGAGDPPNCIVTKVCASPIDVLKSILRPPAVLEEALHDAGRCRQDVASSSPQGRTVRLSDHSL